MEDIYYLVHKTKTDDYKKWSELKPSKLKTNKSNITEADVQFPGVYFSLITKDNINSERLYAGKYVLIFSYKLLNQKNYHINIHDNNGIISETNTYYPWNIKDAVDKIASMTNPKNKKVSTNNEVVFHDPISMKYCCREIELPSAKEIAHLSDKEYDEYLSNPNSFLPRERICAREPDMSKKPFYCYPQDEEEYKEDNTNIDETLSSSNNFLKTMAKVCNVDTKLEKTKLVNEIKSKVSYLYDNRNKQNIQALKDFSNKEKKIGGIRRKTKRKGKKVNNRKKKRTIKRKQYNKKGFH